MKRIKKFLPAFLFSPYYRFETFHEDVFRESDTPKKDRTFPTYCRLLLADSKLGFPLVRRVMTLRGCRNDMFEYIDTGEPYD